MGDESFFLGSFHSSEETASVPQSSSAPVFGKFVYGTKYRRKKVRGNSVSCMSLCDPITDPINNIQKKLDVSDFLGTSPPIKTIAFSELKDMKRVAIGRNAIVYKAEFMSECVAVKVLMPGLEKYESVRREFLMEQRLLSSLRHPNIVRLIGCGEEGSQVFTVLEWLENSLQDLINLRAQNRLKRFFADSSGSCLPKYFPVILQISSVLRYLHEEVSLTSSKNGTIEITHRAIVPEHFRYNGTPQCNLKLTSFMGCHLLYRSRKGISEERMELCVAPNVTACALYYTPPEIALRISLSSKSDVYAFAILCWHLLKRKVPFFGLSRGDFMSRVIYKGERLRLPRSWCEEFCKVLESCWQNDPNSRPCMGEVHDKLVSISHILIEGSNGHRKS